MTRDDSSESAAAERWKDQLLAYLDAQPGVDELRSRAQPRPPWPETDNPMFAYIIERSAELLQEEGPGPAIIWAASHAWFESALDTRASIIRHVSS